MRVVQGRRRSSAQQRMTRDALGFLRLLGRIQRDGQGMGCDGVVRERVPPDDDSSPRPRSGGPGPHMRQRAAPTNRHRPCRCRTRESQPRAPMPAGLHPGSGEPTAVLRGDAAAAPWIARCNKGTASALRPARSNNSARLISVGVELGVDVEARVVAATPPGRLRPRLAWCQRAAAGLPRSRDLRLPEIPIACALPRSDRIAAGR